MLVKYSLVYLIEKSKESITERSSLALKICDRVAKYAIYIAIFLIPIFFLPWTADVLDFNKQALLLVLIFVSLFAFLSKILISGKFEINDANWRKTGLNRRLHTLGLTGRRRTICSRALTVQQPKPCRLPVAGPGGPNAATSIAAGA